MSPGHQLHAYLTAGATAAGALFAEVGAPTQVTLPTIALGLISLASLWIRGYWANHHAVVRNGFLEKENARLEGRLSAYERALPPPAGPAGTI